MAGSIAPVCVPCGTVMLCSKTGRRVLEWSSDGEPIRVHAGDEFECPECKTRVVQGFAQQPICEAWQGDRFPKFLREQEDYAKVPYRRYAQARNTRAPLPTDADHPVGAHQLTDRERLRSWLEGFLGLIEHEGGYPDDDALALHVEFAFELADDQAPSKQVAEWLSSARLQRERDEERNPREKGDDDGVEYGHPGDAIEERRR